MISIRSLFLAIVFLSALPFNAQLYVELNDIEPSTIMNDIDSVIQLMGTGFQDGANVIVGEHSIQNVQYVSSSRLNATIPAGFPKGIYNVKVVNPDSGVSTMNNGLEVLAPESTVTPTPTNTHTSTVTPTITLTNTPAYSRPILYISSFSTNPVGLKPGAEFDIQMEIFNNGQMDAYNVTLAFSIDEIYPQKEGNICYLGDIPRGTTQQFNQQLSVSSNLKKTTDIPYGIEVTYYDQFGKKYSEEMLVLLTVHSSSLTSTSTSTVTATGYFNQQKQSTITPSASPASGNEAVFENVELSIVDVETNMDTLHPGMQFDLSFQVINLSDEKISNLTVVVGGAQMVSLNPSESDIKNGVSALNEGFDLFSPGDFPYIHSLGSLSPGELIKVNQILTTDSSISPGTYPLKISLVYTNENGKLFLMDQWISLSIQSPQVVELDVSTYDPQLGVFEVELVNVGRTTAYLGTVSFYGDNVEFVKPAFLIGLMEPGERFTLELETVSFQESVEFIYAKLEYFDEFNRSQMLDYSIPVSGELNSVVSEIQDIPETGGKFEPELLFIQSPEPPETVLELIFRIIKGMIGFGSG